MEVLKIKGYQPFANYRIPNSYKVWDTYLLPTPSSIRGWFHYVIGAKEYQKMAVSIHGKHGSIVYDLQKVIKIKAGGSKSSKSKENEIYFNGRKGYYTPDILYCAMLIDVNLTLYIKAEKENLEKFKENVLKLEYPTLGRKEDFIRIDYIDIIELEEKKFKISNPYTIKEGLYLNKSTIDKYELDITGTHYRLDFKYHKKYFKNDIGIRYFEKKDLVYLDSGVVNSGKFWYDKEDNKIVDLIGDV